MDPKQLLLEHFEKAIFGGFALWFLVAGVGMAVPPAELKKNEALGQKLDKIKAYMDTAEPKAEGSADWTADLKKGIDTQGVRPVDRGIYPGWLIHRRPNIAFVVQDAPTRPQPIHSPPKDLRGDATKRGRVELTWSSADSSDNAYIRIDQYEVQRRELPKGQPPGQWSTLGVLKRDPAQELPPTTWVDEKVAPRTKYEYRILETAVIDDDHEQVRKWKLKLPDLPKAPVERDIAWAMESETPRDIFVMPSDAQIPPPAEAIKGAVPTCTLKIYKYDPKLGQFVDKTYFGVKEGEKKVGQLDTYKGQKIDFTTGAEILEVRREKRKVKMGGAEVEREVAIIKVKWPGDETEEVIEGEMPEELKKALGKK